MLLLIDICLIFIVNCKNDQSGYSVFIKFTSLYKVEIQREEVHHIAGRAFVPYLQVQLITVNIDSIMF